MKLEELHEMWTKDGEIDIINVSSESSKTPKLHSKYYIVYVQEGLKLKRLRAEYKKLRLTKEQYYKGELDIEELKQYGWPAQPMKILRQDIPVYLDADDDIINMSLKIGMQEAKVEYLESIIRQINNRGFQIRAIVDWEKFRTGG